MGLIFILDTVYSCSLKNSIFFHFYINFNCNRVKKPRHSPRNIETGSNEFIEVLIHGEINFSLLGLTDPNMAFDIDTQVIAHYPLRIIVAKTHPWANRSGVYFRELANQNFIGLSSNYLHNQILQQLIKQNQIGLNTIYRSPAVAVVKALVAKNLGVSYLTSLAINDDDQVVALPLLDANQPDFILAAATRQNHLMTAKEELLWEILTKNKRN
ncbi:LysR substrate-binding domain-containing protein [Lactobacillus gigeriorum]|nr:LysR substrate-binding domain-containing protein [Lactobacillus gigeriorum]